MQRLIAAEFRKLSTTWLWLWLLLAAVALTALYVSLTIVFQHLASNPTPPLSSGAGQRTLFEDGNAAEPLIAILGTIGITGEFRHKTVVATFLATPRRGRVVIAKMVTYGLTGMGYAIVCNAAALAIGWPWLATEGIHVSPFANGIPAAQGGVVIAVALYGVIGVGLGALVREQVWTVVALLVYMLVVEPVLLGIQAFHTWATYLPGGAANALTQVVNGTKYLRPWQGGLVLAGYGVAFALAGARLTLRRDVT